MRKLKIYFDNVNFSSNSGPNSFGSRLAHELVKNYPVEIVSHKDQYDIFLCFIEPTHQPKTGTILCQRLDGIWFKPDQFESHNKLIKWAYDNSSAVIWQSEFDKNMTQHWWGNKHGKTIHNGIDLSPAVVSKEFLEWRKKHDMLFVSAASWHRQKRLKENIEFFKNVSSPKDAMVVLGGNPDHVVKDSNIFYLGQKSHEECLAIYSCSDWMIHLAWLDHCPNVVVEALSQNCPVICTDSGGTKEIVRQNGIILKEKPYNYELADYDNPPSLNLRNILLQDIEVYNSYLDINQVAEKYHSLFEELWRNR